ncbi:MAG: polysaccharide biosynthesis protein [Bacteroidota bacterium]
MKSPWQDRSVLITGVCGTVGSALLKLLLEEPVKEVIGIDCNETELFFVDQQYRDEKRVSLYLCDIKNRVQLKRYFREGGIVLHTAARKHVIINELAPQEAVQTNIIGTQNVIDSAIDAGSDRVIFTSSDKAVNPTNVMGTSKLMGERLMTAANAMTSNQPPIFASTRFGNVLGSNGSVIPIFQRQIEAGGPVTVTDMDMSRFVMTLDEAAKLVLQSVFLAKGGEVFVTKMPSLNIGDLAKAMIAIAKDEKGDQAQEVDISIIGAKPGEKLFEELINEEEVRRTVEIEDYFAVLPAWQSVHGEIDYRYGDQQTQVDRIYRSDLESKMNVEEIQSYLQTNELV